MKYPLIVLFAFLCFVGIVPSVYAQKGKLTPRTLRCEYKINPLAVEARQPRLFWTVVGEGRGLRQTAYQIVASDASERLAHDEGNLWDSGRVDSDATIQIPYRGKPLESGRQVFWKVRVWDAQGNISGWSAPATWTMGLLRPSDWTAQWIAAPSADSGEIDLTGAEWIWLAADGDTPPAGTRYFSGELRLPADAVVSDAKIALSADDRYTIRINDNAAHRGPTTSDSWRAYQNLNITGEIHSGMNRIVIQAENTLAGPAGVIARLRVTTKTGTFDLVTDGAWHATKQATGNGAPVRVMGDYGVAPWGRLMSVSANRMTPPPYFRKTVTITKPIKRALLYASAFGIYELALNGKRVGDDVLSPGWTDYRKRVHYLAYDVTKQLKRGANDLGAILGDGWYASYLAFTGRRHYYGGDPKLRLQLMVEYQDGGRETVGTDKTWTVTTGAIQSADMLMGCTMDTRNMNLEREAGNVAVVQTDPEILLESQPNAPIRTTVFVKARTRTTPKEGIAIYNMGQNMVGFVRLKVTGNLGDVITVRHAERLNPDGTLYLTNLRSAKATDTYILRGGTQTLEPKFTFHGFQYVEVRGFETMPATTDVVGVAISSDLKPTLEFDSDNPLLNKLVHNIDWGFRGNSLDVPTDCPQRDERAGWMGDAQVFAKTAMFHRDAAPFFAKWLGDIEDGQFPDGSYPDVAPSILGGGNAAWEDAGVICAYRMYEMYGDTAIIETHWASLTRFMAHLAKVAPDGIRPAGAFGDWLLLDGLQQSPIHGTAYYYRCATLMAEMADAIGKPDEAKQYQDLATKIRDAFQSHFVTADGQVKDGDQESQTFYALALEWNLLPEKKRTAAVTRLTAALQARGGRLATGFIGTPVLLPALAHSGRADQANALLLSEVYPSWLYQVKIGATTMWERWDGWTPEKGFQDPSMNSFNHYWLGCVGEWIYTGIAGLDTDGAGWKKIVIRPHIEGALKRAKVRYDSVQGRIESEWSKGKGGTMTLRVVIPANTTATIYAPMADVASMTESGHSVAKANGVQFLRLENGAAVFAVGSGKYTFRYVLQARNRNGGRGDSLCKPLLCTICTEGRAE